MNQWKSMHAVETDLRTLEEAMDGADVFFGLSVKDAITQDMVASMAAQPIILPWPTRPGDQTGTGRGSP